MQNKYPTWKTDEGLSSEAVPPRARARSRARPLPRLARQIRTGRARARSRPLSDSLDEFGRAEVELGPDFLSDSFDEFRAAELELGPRPLSRFARPLGLTEAQAKGQPKSTRPDRVEIPPRRRQ
jgi:hypothetical protein